MVSRLCNKKSTNPNAHLYKGDLFAKIIIKVERSTDTSAAVAVGESTKNLEGEMLIRV